MGEFPLRENHPDLKEDASDVTLAILIIIPKLYGPKYGNLNEIYWFCCPF